MSAPSAEARRDFDRAGYNPECDACRIVGEACNARGHRPLTAAELERLRLRAERELALAAERPVCRVCGSAECETARRAGRPQLCD